MAEWKVVKCFDILEVCVCHQLSVERFVVKSAKILKHNLGFCSRTIAEFSHVFLCKPLISIISLAFPHVIRCPTKSCFTICGLRFYEKNL